MDPNDISDSHATHEKKCNNINGESTVVSFCYSHFCTVLFFAQIHLMIVFTMWKVQLHINLKESVTNCQFTET